MARSAITRAAIWLRNTYPKYKFIPDETERTLVILLEDLRISESMYFPKYTELVVITKRARDFIKEKIGEDIEKHISDNQAKLF